jgi:hypothetical protein
MLQERSSFPLSITCTDANVTSGPRLHLVPWDPGPIEACCDSPQCSRARPLWRKGFGTPYAGHPTSAGIAPGLYLSRYTHRVAIANSRLISFGHAGVTFKWKDYRAKGREPEPCAGVRKGHRQRAMQRWRRKQRR